MTRDFFLTLSTLQLIQCNDLFSNSVFIIFFLKLPGNVLGAAYNQVRLIVRNLRCTQKEERKERHCEITENMWCHLTATVGR